MKHLCVPREEKIEPMRPILGVIPPCNVSDQFFYLQLKFTPKIGHTFTDEREVVVEVPKDLVQRKSRKGYHIRGRARLLKVAGLTLITKRREDGWRIPSKATLIF